MGSQAPPATGSLPDQASPSLGLVHPTKKEKIATWTLNSESWAKVLGLESYLEREEHLTKIPLADNGGVTHWILVDTSSQPDDRAIYASCESLCKPALVRTSDGTLKEVVSHGIGSVYCNPKYRGRGYAGRMLKELGPVLREWQTKKGVPGREECKFSFLYSDIGKNYYSNLGWRPFPSSHIEFSSSSSLNNQSSSAIPLKSADIPELCKIDQQYLRKSLQEVKDARPHVALVPNHHVMEWHHIREDFMTSKLFGKSPVTKGAIVGKDGARVWAIWTRMFSGALDDANSGNTLHILRLVIEDWEAKEANSQALKDIIELAKREATEWKCLHVELWNPTEQVKELVTRTGLEYKTTDRESESIASLMWYGSGSNEVEEIEWVGNEKYGWC